MNIEQIIANRRTIDPDNFNGNIIPDDDMQTILEAANWAPTHGHTEPWNFIIFKGEDCKKFGQIHATLFKNNTEPKHFLQKKYDKILHRADNCSHVIICTNKRGTANNIPDLEEICASSAAIQNMLLVATAKNIASFWSTGGFCHHPTFKAHFGYQEEDTVLGILYLGYSNLPLPAGKRNSNIETKIKYYKE
jgi:nitroreductase